MAQFTRKGARQDHAPPDPQSKRNGASEQASDRSQGWRGLLSSLFMTKPAGGAGHGLDVT